MLNKRKVVLGLGNLLQKDEGFGIHAIERLAGMLEWELDDDLELVDGGVLGLNLLPLIEDSSHLLILDAIDAHQQPGAVIEMTGDLIPLFTSIKLSEHQLGFQEVLGLAKFRGSFPEHLHLIGVQPEDLTTGLTLSPVVKKSLDEVVRRTVAYLQTW